MPTARKPYAYFCGTPVEHCGGSIIQLNHGLAGRGMKGHGSSPQAFACHRRYLLKMGYTQIGGQAFRAPDDRPTLILTKKGRFGGKLRNGKEGTRNQPAGGRRAASGIVVLV